MRKKTFFIYSILFALIFIMVPKISYSKKKVAKPRIYGSEAEAEAATKDTPRKKYKAKIGVIKRDTTMHDAHQFQSNSKDFFVPIYSNDIELVKGELVIVYGGENSKVFSIVRKFTDPPIPSGKVKKSDISFDIEDFKNIAGPVYFISVPVYDSINGKLIYEDERGIGSITEKKDGWLKIDIWWNFEGYWIKESDMNYDYNSVEHVEYDI